MYSCFFLCISAPYEDGGAPPEIATAAAAAMAAAGIEVEAARLRLGLAGESAVAATSLAATAAVGTSSTVSVGGGLGAVKVPFGFGGGSGDGGSGGSPPRASQKSPKACSSRCRISLLTAYTWARCASRSCSFCTLASRCASRCASRSRAHSLSRACFSRSFSFACCCRSAPAAATSRSAALRACACCSASAAWRASTSSISGWRVALYAPYSASSRCASNLLMASTSARYRSRPSLSCRTASCIFRLPSRAASPKRSRTSAAASIVRRRSCTRRSASLRSALPSPPAPRRLGCGAAPLGAASLPPASSSSSSSASLSLPDLSSPSSAATLPPADSAPAPPPPRPPRAAPSVCCCWALLLPFLLLLSLLLALHVRSLPAPPCVPGREKAIAVSSPPPCSRAAPLPRPLVPSCEGRRGTRHTVLGGTVLPPRGDAGVPCSAFSASACTACMASLSVALVAAAPSGGRACHASWGEARGTPSSATSDERPHLLTSAALFPLNCWRLTPRARRTKLFRTSGRGGAGLSGSPQREADSRRVSAMGGHWLRPATETADRPTIPGSAVPETTPLQVELRAGWLTGTKGASHRWLRLMALPETPKPRLGPPPIMAGPRRSPWLGTARCPRTRRFDTQQVLKPESCCKRSGLPPLLPRLREWMDR
eukprot:scaffold43107_cov69-Phaeocystis_antarctica.AAC.8